MSLSSDTPPDTPPSPALSSDRPRWWREPLLHFLLLGAAVFGVDHLISGRGESPRTIVIDAAVDQEAIKVFRDARGKDPNTDELYALRRVWLDNEVLYREGLALQMDKGDKAIRDRVIFKALSMINAGLKLPPVDDSTLKAWFEKHRQKYDEPARYDFSEAVTSGDDATEAGAQAFAARLNSASGGEANTSLRVFKGRPHGNLMQSYGEAFTRALQALPPGSWQALRHGEVWRVVRLEAVSAARPASFDNLRGVVLQDWTDAVMSEQRAAAVKAMALKYTIRQEAGAGMPQP